MFSFMSMRARVYKDHPVRAAALIEGLEVRALLSAAPAVVLDFGVGAGASAVGHASAAPAASASMNGAAGQMTAIYDGRQITVNMMELPDAASAALIAKNASINTIYATNDLDEEQDFAPVIDAIQGDGFNPLWRQVLIQFNPGFTPHQFNSDDQIEAAASGPHPEITLVPTDEVYRCAVVGSAGKKG
jgi:hypothetical protein